MRDILKTVIELIDKKKVKIGRPTMKKEKKRKEKKRNQRLKGIQENFEKCYIKAKKKGKENARQF